MRRNLFCTLLQAVALSLFAVPASPQSQKTATVSMRPYAGTRPVVAVKINGAGPYDFLVDTGATATVLDAYLFQQLGLQAEGSTAVSSSNGSDGQNYSTAREISVGGLAVEDLRVLSLKSLPFSSDYHGVRGILGENFLRHFDVLIDNQRRKIVLDAGSALAESLDGERLPITFPVSDSGEVRYAPMVSVRVEGVGSNALTVLLDSGADDLSVDTTHAVRTGGGVMRIATVSGSMPCSSSEDRLHWGKATVGGIKLVLCQVPARSGRDHEGNLPTGIFKQIFISHAGSYAIVNPGKNKLVAQEIAAVTPLER